MQATWAAFRMLGMESYHCAEMGRNQVNNDVFPRWREAIDAKYFGGKGRKLETREEFEQLLWRYQVRMLSSYTQEPLVLIYLSQAVTDIPCVLFTDELLKAYPEAKVVLTERDVDGWIKSVQNSFINVLSWRIWYLLKVIDPVCIATLPQSAKRNRLTDISPALDKQLLPDYLRTHAHLEWRRAFEHERAPSRLSEAQPAHP